LSEFRKAVLPIVIQKRIYKFIRFCFERWPLDQGFRMILETWLSYVQPWRYVDPTVGEKEDDNRADEVGEEWSTDGFIGANILHFVIPFQDFLKRLFRMDLSSPKNAHMLYRVCKVFNQPRLKEYLLSAEQLIEPSLCNAFPFKGGLNSSFLDGTSFLSPSAGFVPELPAALVGLENNLIYTPLFGQEVRANVEQLVQVIVQALGTTRSLLPPEPKSKDPNESSNNVFLATVSSMFSTFAASSERSTINDDDMTIVDVRRMEVHLRQSLQHLTELFEVEQPANLTVGSTASISSIGASFVGQASGIQNLGPDAPDNVDGVLTELGRWQLKNGLKRFRPPGFRGDPDLHPIQSFESAVLVRALYRMACRVNDRFGRVFEDTYSRPDIVGRVARQFLLPPCDIAGSPMGSKKAILNEYSGRPRISLRFLGNKQTLGSIFLVLLVAPGFGVSRFACLFCLALFFFFLNVITALVKPKTL